MNFSWVFSYGNVVLKILGEDKENQENCREAICENEENAQPQ